MVELGKKLWFFFFLPLFLLPELSSYWEEVSSPLPQSEPADRKSAAEYEIEAVVHSTLINTMSALTWYHWGMFSSFSDMSCQYVPFSSCCFFGCFFFGFFCPWSLWMFKLCSADHIPSIVCTFLLMFRSLNLQLYGWVLYFFATHLHGLKNWTFQFVSVTFFLFFFTILVCQSHIKAYIYTHRDARQVHL